MADNVKSLYYGSVPTSAIGVYSVPVGKYAVIKSLIATNTSSADRIFTISIGGISLATAHILKAGETIVIKELEIPILQGESIVLSTGGNISMFISGFERDYVSQDYPYVKAIGTMTTTLSNLVSIDTTKKWILKGLFLTNSSASVVSAEIKLSGFHLINSKSIAPWDSLIVPLPNIVIPETFTIRGNSSSNNAIQYGFIVERVDG